MKVKARQGSTGSENLSPHRTAKRSTLKRIARAQAFVFTFKPNSSQFIYVFIS